jgi:uncharacterized small protein (DUF1192 family)
MMSDEIIIKKLAIDSLTSETLDELSIEELKVRISILEVEIDRSKKKITNKELSKNAADKIFK